MRSTPASSNRCTLPPPGGKPVTLAVIGAGGWGRIVIATARRLKQVRLAAVASGNPETDSLIGPETKRFDHWSVALGLPGLEAVFICTPPETHADITRTAVKAGLAVMVEKPLTVDVREAEQLVAVARAAGARVAVDHIHLYSAAWAGLRGALAGREIKRISARAGGPRPSRSDVDLLWDWGAHDFAMVADLLDGEPQGLQVTKTQQTDKGETIRIKGHLDDVEIDITLGTDWPAKDRRFAVETTAGTWIHQDHADNKLLQVTETMETSLRVTPELPLDRAVRHLAALARSPKPDIQDLELGLRVVRWLSLAGQRSS